MIIIPLTQGQVAVIDDEDAKIARKYKWHALRSGRTWYARANSHGNVGVGGNSRGRNYNGGRGSIITLHRLIMNFPKNKVDHVDGDGLNCTRKNLREVSSSQNSWNQRISKRNKSGFRGVSFKGGVKRSRPWVACIGFNKKIIEIGHYATAIEAAKAYNEASLKYHGEFGYRNLIP